MDDEDVVFFDANCTMYLRVCSDTVRVSSNEATPGDYTFGPLFHSVLSISTVSTSILRSVRVIFEYLRTSNLEEHCDWVVG